jgi:ribosomal protein S18 acetylase RimI-like enzyme
MPDFLTYLPYLLFMNPRIGLAPTFTTPRCAAIHTGSSLRACNRVFNTDLPTDQEVKQIKQFFGDIPFTWAAKDGDNALRTMLERHHLSHADSFPAMSLELDNIQERPLIDDVSIHLIEHADYSALKTWASIFAVSFNANQQACHDLLTFFTKQTTPNAMHLYIAYYQGIPAAVGMALNHDEVATLHWIGTLPDYRKKGLGTAITLKSLHDIQKAGCTHALLLASASGKPLYERMGFKQYMLYHMYKEKA